MRTSHVRAVALVGVSSGPFAGIRVVQSLLPVMRELGLVTIFWDINVGSVAKVFSEDGRLLDEAFIRRSDRFIRELIWMSKTLQHGREHVTIDEEAIEIVPCPNCGARPSDGARKLFPSDRLRRLDDRIRRYHTDGEHEIVVILVAAFLEAILEDMIDRMLSARGAVLQVRRAVLDGTRAIGGRIGRLIPHLTGEEFEEIAAELGFRDFPHRWRNMREQRNAFIHDTPFRDVQETLDARTAAEAMRLLDQAYLLFVLINNRFVATGRNGRPA